jgi:hypothetical protein
MKGMEDITIDHYAAQNLDATKIRSIALDNPHRDNMRNLARDKATDLYGSLCPP